jgi:hypothetical protein
MATVTSYEEFYKGLGFDAAALKIDVPFVVTGCYNENTARAVAQASSSVFRSGLWRNNITATHEGNGVWKGSIHYGQFQTAQGKWNLDFDTSGGTIRVTHSKAQRAKYGTDAPDTRAIGAHDGQVDGCDIVIPALKLTWSFNHPVMGMPMSRIKTLARFTGQTNSDEWMSFAAGELLFIGATGAMGSETETTVRYNFIASENATGLTIGSIAGIAKKGHDYLDVIWQDEVVGGKDVKTAKYVYSHRVYDETAFATLLGF